MTLEQAIEILDPKNPYYKDSYAVQRARYMGMEALSLRIPKKVGNRNLLKLCQCPSCGHGYYYEDLEEPFDDFCSNCGQALDWSSLNWPDDKYAFENLLQKEMEKQKLRGDVDGKR